MHRHTLRQRLQRSHCRRWLNANLALIHERGQHFAALLDRPIDQKLVSTQYYVLYIQR